MTKPAICAGLGLLVASGTAFASNNDAEESAEPLAASAPVVSVPLADNDMRVFWKNNLHFETADKQFTAQLGGSLQFDMVLSSFGDDLKTAGVDPGNSMLFRRARLYAEGTIYETIGYRVQYDFANAEGFSPQFRDAYMELHDFLGGALRVGQFKVPFSLEEQIDGNHTTFMERSLLNSFVRSRALGVGYFGSRNDDMLNYGVSWTHSDGDNLAAPGFSPSDQSTGDGSNELFTRVTYAMDMAEDMLLHFGGGIGYQTFAGSNGNAYSFVWPVSPGLSAAAITPPLPSAALDSNVQLGGEVAFVTGPFHTQGELTVGIGDGIATDSDSRAAYWQAGYFLTGETRPYSKGRFTAVQPKSDWKGFGNGTGALELAARFGLGTIDIDGAGEIDATDLTLGANWYLNANTRVMANWVLTDVDAAALDDDVSALQLRFQVTF